MIKKYVAAVAVMMSTGVLGCASVAFLAQSESNESVHGAVCAL